MFPASRPCSPSRAPLTTALRALLLLPPLWLGATALTAAQFPTRNRPATVEPITPIPAPPAQDPRRLALGEQLFHDQRLSHNNAVSCNTCHDTGTNGASASAHDVTPTGMPIELNTPTVFNASLNFRLNWEGNLRTFERQVEESLQNPQTMGTSLEEVLAKIGADSKLVAQFRDAYGHDPDPASIFDAFAVYERSLLTPDSRFDRWLAGDDNAITDQEYAGYQLFKSLGCISCHQGINVGGNMFQRHGIFHPLAAPQPEILRVPSLRNVATTSPYFHDGSAATLEEAVQAMGLAQLDRVLTDQQTDTIVAFLNTLTGNYRGQTIRPASEASGTGLRQ
jgi:cytochrome c peroxidase